MDAIVRDDLVEVRIALREDLAFLLGDGTQDTPRGWLSNSRDGWVLAQGGTVGVWSQTAASVYAVDGATSNPLTGQNGGNFITSNASFSLTTVVNELGGMVNKLDTANVRSRHRVWIMNPRVKNYLYNLQNSLGVYVFRDEMNAGKLLGVTEFKTTTQIPTELLLGQRVVQQGFVVHLPCGDAGVDDPRQHVVGARGFARRLVHQRDRHDRLGVPERPDS